MYTTATRVYLSILGDQFDPAALTALVGLAPTEMGIKGELIKGRRIPCRESFWSLHAEPSTDLDLEEVYKPLLRQLAGKERIMHQFMLEHRLEAVFNIVVYIANNQTPGLHFNRAFLTCVHELQAEIDIDSYIVDSR